MDYRNPFLNAPVLEPRMRERNDEEAAISPRSMGSPMRSRTISPARSSESLRPDRQTHRELFDLMTGLNRFDLTELADEHDELQKRNRELLRKADECREALFLQSRNDELKRQWTDVAAYQTAATRLLDQEQCIADLRSAAERLEEEKDRKISELEAETARLRYENKQISSLRARMTGSSEEVTGLKAEVAHLRDENEQIIDLRNQVNALELQNRKVPELESEVQRLKEEQSQMAVKVRDLLDRHARRKQEARQLHDELLRVGRLARDAGLEPYPDKTATW